MSLEALPGMTTVTVLFVTMLALILILVLILELRRARAARHVDLLLELERRFESEEFRRKRSKASTFLLEHLTLDPEDATWSQVDGVLDFFEVLGTCVRLGHIRRELAYTFFFHWLRHYRSACEGYITTARSHNAAQWENAEWLASKLAAYESRRTKSRPTNPDNVDLDRFLKEEQFSP